MRHFMAMLVAAGALTAASLAANAHGCHQTPAEGYGGWHRHASESCRRIDLPPPGYADDDEFDDAGPPPPRAYYDRPHRHRRHYDGPICRQECIGVGPLRVCERKCY